MDEPQGLPRGRRRLLRLRRRARRRPRHQGSAGRRAVAARSCPRAAIPESQQRSQPFVNVLYLALSLIIMGVGFLKANISSIVGQLYPQGDPRRDPGFTLYYYGINLGAFWASILCGAVGPDRRLGRGLRPRRRRHAGRLSGLRVQQAAARGPRRAARSGPAGQAGVRADQARVAALSGGPRRRRRRLGAGAPIRADGLDAARRLDRGAGLPRLGDGARAARWCASG